MLTSTPVRNEIADNKTRKKCQASKRKTKNTKKRQTTKQKSTKKARKTLFVQSSSESDTAEEPVVESDEVSEDSDDEIIEGDFVVVRVEGKSREVRYIAQVDVLDNEELEGVFLKKVPQPVGHKPVFILNENDFASFQRKDVVVKLPDPVKNSGSTRKSNQLVFPVDVTMWLH